MREAARLIKPTGEVLIQVLGPAYLSEWQPALDFFTEVSLVDKLVGYHPAATRVMHDRAEEN